MTVLIKSILLHIIKYYYKIYKYQINISFTGHQSRHDLELSQCTIGWSLHTDASIPIWYSSQNVEKVLDKSNSGKHGTNTAEKIVCRRNRYTVKFITKKKKLSFCEVYIQV